MWWKYTLIPQDLSKCVQSRLCRKENYDWTNVVAIKVDWQARICLNMSRVVCGAHQLWANTTLLRSIGRGDRWPHWGKSIENLNLEANQVVPGSHQIQLQGSNCEHSRYKRRRKTQIWEVRSLDCKLWTIKICRTNCVKIYKMKHNSTLMKPTILMGWLVVWNMHCFLFQRLTNSKFLEGGSTKIVAELLDFRREKNAT